MSYSQLTALLDATQFEQMRTVREHLMQDPTALDKATPIESKDSQNGDQEINS